MLKDIPYSVLKEDERAYEIMLLHDQHGNTYTNIAKEYEISVARVVQIYNKMKIKQKHLYIHHIAVVLGHESTEQVNKVYHDADECYQDRTYACAYLEKKYKDILTEYRDGEPGMPAQFIKSMPPFRPELSEETIARVVEMREAHKASFVTIAEELHMTGAKAKHTYESFYRKKVLKNIKELQEKTQSNKEKDAIWDYYFERNISSKKRYDMLTKEQVPKDSQKP